MNVLKLVQRAQSASSAGVARGAGTVRMLVQNGAAAEAAHLG